MMPNHAAVPDEPVAAAPSGASGSGDVQPEVPPPPPPHSTQTHRRVRTVGRSTCTYEWACEGGSIKYYPYGDGQLVAECKGRGHGRCRLSRTVSRLDSIPAQERPLGLLIAWLRVSEFVTESYSRVHFWRPTDHDCRVERDRCVALQETDPIVKSLLECERGRRPHEPLEPDGIE